MRILIIGGFLGSGKTTVINRLLKGIAAEGNLVAIIENEIGDTSIDDTLLSQTEVQITPLFGGCVCCQITGDLLYAIKEIENKIQPDYILVEMTGLALMSDMKKKMMAYTGLNAEIITISVADISRWPVLIRAMGKMIANQIGGADLVLANKTDLAVCSEEIKKDIDGFSGGVPCIPVKANQEEGLWEHIKDVMQL